MPSRPYFQPYDSILCEGRPATFLWYAWKGRNYARVRFEDGERRVVNMIDVSDPTVSSVAVSVEHIQRVFDMANVVEAVDAVEEQRG